MTDDASQLPAKKGTQEDPATDGNLRDKWLAEFMEALVLQVYRLTEEQAATYGDEFATEARLGILTSLICTMVFKVLREQPKGTSLRNLEHATKMYHVAYADAKGAIQHAIERGFEAAIKEWRGDSPDYYCSIEIVPDAQNKEAC